MNEDTDDTAVQRTVFPSDEDTLQLGVWVSPPRCGKCGGRVDTWFRLDRPTPARCSGCGREWTIE